MSEYIGLYSVKDVVAEEFGPVFMAVNDGVALRSFGKLIQEVPEPQEYELYSVGVFKPDSGRIITLGDEPRKVEFLLSPDRKYGLVDRSNECKLCGTELIIDNQCPNCGGAC